MNGPDDVGLTQWEEERLAAIEGHLTSSDPGFTRAFTRCLSEARRKVSMAVAIALIAVGWVVTLATFTRSMWLAAGGLLLIGVGGGRAVTELAGRSCAVRAAVTGWLRRHTRR